MYQQPRPQQLQRSLSQKKRDQAEARKAFSNEWQVGLFNAPCSNPGYCCYAFFCGSCAAYGQRKLQMGPAWPSQYTCCNGGTCISGRCGERSNPELCLCCEVCCCFPSAMATTRFMIQDEQRVMNTKCDNCLIGFMLCTQQLALCLRCIAMITNNPDIESLADAVDCLADLTYASVCACMLTQQQIQIQYRDSRARGGVVPGPMEAPTPPTMQPVARSGPRVVQPAQAQTTYVYTAPPPRPAPPIAQHHTPPPRPSPAHSDPYGRGGKPANYYPDV